MKKKKEVASWKFPLLLLGGVGLSNIGDWIYLIALNLIVLDKTGSALAVAVLYMLKPAAALVTNSWSGSLIDRWNQRNLLIGMDILRGLLLVTLPWMDSMAAIYIIVFIVNMSSAIFEPTSMTYITKLIPIGKRKRFNSLRSLIDSGGFLIGPAIAGALFIIGSPWLAIYVNAATFIISGIITSFLPILTDNVSRHEKITLSALKKDWGVVWKFSKDNRWIMSVYFLFALFIVMTAAIDSLEAAFSKEVLHLSDAVYGLLVSVAGAGIAVGAIVATIFAHRLSTSVLMGIGTVSVTVGYLIYAISDGFTGAGIGFFVLSFSLAFANTGFMTFYQNEIPVEVMGRVTSVYGMAEAGCVIIATAFIGAAAQLTSIQASVMAGAIAMLCIALVLCLIQLKQVKVRTRARGMI
ncbi:MFS transporter [Thalassobacillus hwangdonensis]|uniref:MFS transporter n=1 Tax=Thalassobacillus hwangdonensis TaxID=546108 RepID=A0ABW3L5W2_9BACI